MIFKSMFGRSLRVSLILGASVIAGAETPAAEGRALPKRGSGKYWLLVDQFADDAAHFAYAKRFVQLHGRSLTDRQCQRYSASKLTTWTNWQRLDELEFLLKAHSGMMSARTRST
jgi:hypothetical protein